MVVLMFMSALAAGLHHSHDCVYVTFDDLCVVRIIRYMYLLAQR